MPPSTHYQFKSIFLLCLLGFSFFEAKSQFVLNADAIDLGGDCFQLTPAAAWRTGSVYHPTLIDLRKPFAIRTSLYFGSLDGTGADGMAFLLQPISTAVGSSGGGMGYQGISPSLAVEFDTYENTSFLDPITDHVSFQQNGILDHTGASALTTPVDISALSGNVEDAAFHSVLINWDPTINEMSVEVDCAVRTSYTGDIIATIFGGDPLVYVGFTGSTGGLFNNQRVCFEFLEVGEGPDTLEVCAGSSLILEGPEEFIGYSWTPSADLDDPTIANPTATPAVTTVYQVTFTDDCGNNYIDSFVVNVDPGPGPVFDLGADTTICAGTSISLFGPAGADSYLWSDGSTASSLVAAAGGIYYLEAFLGFCVSEDSIIVSEINVELDLGNDVSACPGDSVLIGVTEIPGLSYSWSNGVNTASQYIDDEGIYTLTFDSLGCITEDEIEFTYNPFPAVSLPDSSGWCANNPFSLNANGSASNWLWSNGDLGVTLQNVDMPGEYWVEGSLAGCISRDTTIIYELVYCDCAPIFPNAFSPNGDGLNDLFLGRNLDVCPFTNDFQFSVYNRWGELIFSTRNEFTGWDGTFKGKRVEMASYIWIVEYTLEGEAKTIKSGSVTIVR
ncbi:MAG: gliding motility-associated-like protein [Limisphaerales bacterium]|jgi:gliding motility-associated-like protein